MFIRQTFHVFVFKQQIITIPKDMYPTRKEWDRQESTSWGLIVIGLLLGWLCYATSSTVHFDFVWCPNAKENETRNLANLGGLRARLSLKQEISDYNDDDEECRPWRRRLFMAFTWGSALRITLLLLLLAAVVIACFTLPVEKVLFFHLGLC